MEKDVLCGVIVSLIGNACISIGDHLRIFGRSRNSSGKLHHHRNSKKHRHKCTKEVFCTLLGYIIMLFGQVCNGYSLAYAPQTLLACMGSIQFIVNLLCSAAMLGRPIKGVHWFGTIAIIGGCLIMVFGFSPKNDEDLTVLQLFYNYNSWQYRWYLVVVVVIFSLSLIWQHLNCIPVSNNKKELSPSLSKNNRGCDLSYVAGFFYSFSSAMTGTQSVVLGKSLAIIVRRYYVGQIQFFDPSLDVFNLMFVTVTVISYCITFLFWMYRRAESMVLFDHVFIAPLNQVMWLTFSTVAGGVYFKEFESAHTLQWISLLCGMSLNYAGLAYLVPTSADRPRLEINTELPPSRYKKRKKTKRIHEEYQQITINNDCAPHHHSSMLTIDIAPKDHQKKHGLNAGSIERMTGEPINSEPAANNPPKIAYYSSRHRSQIDSYSNPNLHPCHSQMSRSHFIPQLPPSPPTSRQYSDSHSPGISNSAIMMNGNGSSSHPPTTLSAISYDKHQSKPHNMRRNMDENILARYLSSSPCSTTSFISGSDSDSDSDDNSDTDYYSDDSHSYSFDTHTPIKQKLRFKPKPKLKQKTHMRRQTYSSLALKMKHIQTSTNVCKNHNHNQSHSHSQNLKHSHSCSSIHTSSFTAAAAAAADTQMMIVSQPELVPLISLSSNAVRSVSDTLSITDRIGSLVKSIYGKHG